MCHSAVRHFWLYCYISGISFIRKARNIACRICASPSHSSSNHIATQVFRFGGKPSTNTSSDRKHGLDCTCHQSCFPLSPRAHSPGRVWVPHPSTSYRISRSLRQTIFKYAWCRLRLLFSAWTRSIYKKRLAPPGKPHKSDHHDRGSLSYPYNPPTFQWHRL